MDLMISLNDEIKKWDKFESGGTTFNLWLVCHEIMWNRLTILFDHMVVS